MKKILFNDRYRLTGAVLEGRKTMTRRIVPANESGRYTVSALKSSRYKQGDVVAIAQPYIHCYRDALRTLREVSIGAIMESAGWMNKMFVRSEWMPNRIKITKVDVERLQDISDEDCLREGVQAVKTPYGIRYVAGGEKVPDFEVPLSVKCSFKTPREAFAALIDRVSGKGTWADNPLVFVYSFELIKTPEPAFPPAPAQSARKSFVAGVGFEPTTSGL